MNFETASRAASSLSDVFTAEGDAVTVKLISGDEERAYVVGHNHPSEWVRLDTLTPSRELTELMDRDRAAEAKGQEWGAMFGDGVGIDGFI